jgi:hypothetical protein
MDKKLFEDLVKTHCVTEEPVWQETVYESELDPETGLEQVIEREVTVKGPLAVKKLKPCLHACAHCDKTVTDQLVNIRLAQDPVPHWRWRCTTCNCYLDPETRSPMEEDAATSIGKIGRYYKRKHLGVEKWARAVTTPDGKPIKKYKLSSMNTSGQEINTEIEESEEFTITRYVYPKDK